jgi:hypothetical protein
VFSRDRIEMNQIDCASGIRSNQEFRVAAETRTARPEDGRSSERLFTTSRTRFDRTKLNCQLIGASKQPPCPRIIGVQWVPRRHGYSVAGVRSREQNRVTASDNVYMAILKNTSLDIACRPATGPHDGKRGRTCSFQNFAKSTTALTHPARRLRSLRSLFLCQRKSRLPRVSTRRAKTSEREPV